MTSVRRISASSGQAPTLLCFPHAGGSASSFTRLAACLPEFQVVAAQYPGRERRFGEAPAARLEELATEVCRDISDTFDLARVVMIGASLGSTVALECARQLYEARSATKVSGMVAIGSLDPSVAERASTSAISAEDLLAMTLSGNEQLLMDKDVRGYFLGTLKSDLDLAAGYRPRCDSVLDADIQMIVGSDDPIISDAHGAAEAWRRWTSASVHLHEVLGGGHLPHTDIHKSRDVAQLVRQFASAQLQKTEAGS